MKIKIGFGFWLVIISFTIAGLLIWAGIAYQNSTIAGDEAKTSREMALICTLDMSTKFHIHPNLKILVNGTVQIIPKDLGIDSLCMHPIHTHDATGLIHIESPVKKDFTLGDFFAVWGKAFDKNQILDYKTDSLHTIILTVNSKVVDTYENTIMNDKDNIIIEYKEGSMNTKKIMNATIETSKGNITIEFFEQEAPKTVANFLKLAKAGFYDGVKFHRVIKGFMIQGGDPLTKDDSKIDFWGTGDPGYKFADEIDASSDLYKTGYRRGIVAMANSGANTNGSQFFIMHQDYPLPPSYTIFGHITSGLDVVDAIANTPTGTNDRPLTAVVIKNVSVQ